MGRTVKLHPVAILLAIAAGSVLDGVVGAIIAIPLAGSISAAVKYLRGHRGRPRQPAVRRRPDGAGAAAARPGAGPVARPGQGAGSAVASSTGVPEPGQVPVSVKKPAPAPRPAVGRAAAAEPGTGVHTDPRRGPLVDHRLRELGQGGSREPAASRSRCRARGWW